MTTFNLVACIAVSLLLAAGFCACAGPENSTEQTRLDTEANKVFIATLGRSSMEPLDSAWIVSGRVMFGGDWHIIATTPTSFEHSRSALNGLHSCFRSTPHQLSLVSLSNCTAVETFMVPDDLRIQRH